MCNGWKGIAFHGKPILKLQVICHPTQVNSSYLNPIQTGWYSICLPRGMEGWVDFGGNYNNEMVYLSADTHPISRASTTSINHLLVTRVDRESNPGPVDRNVTLASHRLIICQLTPVRVNNDRMKLESSYSPQVPPPRQCCSPGAVTIFTLPAVSLCPL